MERLILLCLLAGVMLGMLKILGSDTRWTPWWTKWDPYKGTREKFRKRWRGQ